MGISAGAIKLIGLALRDQQSNGQKKGRAITYGVQGVQSDYAVARTALQSMGLNPHTLPAADIRTDPLTHFPDGLHQEALFKMLGYEQVESIDYYDQEAPTHILDLNQPVPDQMRGQYDLVYDGGTSEHCFEAPTSIKNALRLLKPGGRIIHHLPMNNWVNHGFYQFSPTLFFDFYSANAFTDMKMFFHFMDKNKESYLEYDPVGTVPLPYPVGGRTRVLLFFTALKGAASDTIQIPIQGRYKEKFGGQAAMAMRGGTLNRLKNSFMKRTMKLRSKKL